MGEPKLIAMNERILGHTCVYLATPVDFAGADDIITKLAKERTYARIKVIKRTL